MSEEQRERFDRDGYLIVPGLSTDEVGAYAEALDRVVATREAGGRARADGSLHRLSDELSRPRRAHRPSGRVPAGVAHARVERAHLPLAPGRASAGEGRDAHVVAVAPGRWATEPIRHDAQVRLLGYTYGGWPSATMWRVRREP
jgi:hypothetical protein